MVIEPTKKTSTGSAASDSERIPVDNSVRTRSPRQRRGRGGLGRGLGALIPDAESMESAQQGRPLDVLFPDLQKNKGSSTGSERASRPRGGSARDLLSPPSATKNVSRETLKPKANLDGKKTTVTSNEAPTDPIERSGSEIAGAGAKTDRRKRASAARPSSDATSDRSVSRETITSDLREVPGATFGMIRPDWIIPNLKQPRHVFDADELKELAQSISQVGVLQPIVLRRITDATLAEEGQSDRLREALEDQPEARYEIIMGERRWRASQLAGVEEIPSIIRVTEEDDLLRDALIENLHRVQLNPLEEAAAYSQLMEDFACTQEELSRRIARSRPQIANTLRLLKLPASVQRQLAAGVLSAGHARALLSLDSSSAMESLAARIVAEGLSVRATEEQVKFGKQGKPRTKRVALPPSPEAQRIADAVSDLLETSVSVNASAKRGRLVIEFADQSDLERIAHVLGAEVN